MTAPEPIRTSKRKTVNSGVALKPRPERGVVVVEQEQPKLAIRTVGQAQRALTEAKSITEIKDVHDFATAMKAGAKARGMGIDAENEAAEVILRAERMMGQELIRLAETGALAGKGDWKTRPGGRGNQNKNVVAADILRLEDFGLTRWQAEDFRKLAALDDETWDRTIMRAYDLGRRLARVDFYRVATEMLGPVSPPKPPRNVTVDVVEGVGLVATAQAIEGEIVEPVVLPNAVNVGPVDAIPWLAPLAQAGGALSELSVMQERGWPTTPDLTPRGWQEAVDAFELTLKMGVRFLNAMRTAQAAAGEVEAPIDAD